MTTQPDPGEPAPAVMAERRNLLNVGYRMLGSLVEAEDAVQEAYARWYALTPKQRDEIENPGAWLTTVTSRICLNLLTSARARRELYVGDWLPEPLPEPAELKPRSAENVAADPADRVTLDESVSMALMVVMDSMTPAERVSFILHDVFGYPFAEIAEIVGRSPGACRQLASSARSRVREARVGVAPPDMQSDVVRRFEQAWRSKDIAALVEVLDPEVVATADGGGKALAFRAPIVGRERFVELWLALADRIIDLSLELRSVNGQPGLVARQDGTVVTVYAFDVSADRIRRIWVIRNPEKLVPWAD